MKKIFILLICLIGVLGIDMPKSYAQSYNFTLTERDSCNSGLEHLFFIDYTPINNYFFKLIRKVEAGATIIRHDTSYFSAGYIFETARLGTTKYSLYILDTSGTVILDSFIIVKTITNIDCQSVSIMPFVDINGDCALILLENYAYPQMNVYKNNSLLYTRYSSLLTSSSMLYFNSFDFSPTDTIKVRPDIANSNCVSGNEYSFVFDTFTSSFIYKPYPLMCFNGQDWIVNCSPIYRTVMGVSQVYIALSNHLCDSMGTTMTYRFPENFDFVSTVGLPSYTLYNDSIVFNIGQSAVVRSRFVDVALQNTDSSMVMGDTVQHYISIGNV